MKAESLQEIWKVVDSGIKQKEKEELNSILQSKIRKTMNSFYVSIVISVVISAGFLAFLILTAMNNGDDIVYQINNFSLALLVLFLLGNSLRSWYKLQYNKNRLPLKEWLHLRIQWLGKWLSNSLVWFLLPIFYFMTFFSLSFYDPYLSTSGLNEKPEKLIGMLIGFVIGWAVSFFVLRAKRRYFKRKLEYLKELYNSIAEEY